MPIATRELYLAIARAEEPEPREGWTEDFPLDAPDYDWPDAPDPRVNDDAASVVALYLGGCAFVIFASLVYLLSQVNW